MTLALIPATDASFYVDGSTSPLERLRALDPQAQLGYGIIRPFQRDLNNDFANAGGLDLVKSCVGQVLGTRGASAKVQGELDWDPLRGSLLYLLRHKGSDAVLQQLARTYVVDALKAYEPRVIVKKIFVTFEDGPAGADNVLLIRLKYDVLAAPPPSNAVFLDVDQTVTLPRAA